MGQRLLATEIQRFACLDQKNEAKESDEPLKIRLKPGATKPKAETL